MQATVSELVRNHIFAKDLAKPYIGDAMFPATEDDLFKSIGKALKPLRKQYSSLDANDTYQEVWCVCLPPALMMLLWTHCRMTGRLAVSQCCTHLM